MKHSCVVAAIVISFIVPLSVTAQDLATKQFAARTELHSIPSLTLSDEQFLKGDAGGKSVVVSGYLRIAQGSGRLPVVVMIHASGGMGPNIDLWTKEFNEMGVSTFALDGFTGRGLSSVNTDQALLGRLNMILDVYRVLDSSPSTHGSIHHGSHSWDSRVVDKQRYLRVLRDSTSHGTSQASNSLPTFPFTPTA
jgi:hypothetical protein